jgi:4'-phosphopantetheinyl transferase
MHISSLSNSITCYLGSKSKASDKSGLHKLEIFYFKTKDLSASYSDLRKYITRDELLRAEKFHFNEDKETYISCHALLRLILSKRLNTNPLNISFTKGLNNKPFLPENKLFFNIAHTRDASAIAVSEGLHVGIDLERINQVIDFYSIIETYFSKKERDFILKTKQGERERFFLLWTRKEALLKALGTGVINNLSEIEISERVNKIEMKSFDHLVIEDVFDKIFLYSKKLQDYYLTVALPCNAIINCFHLNVKNIDSYIH